MKKLATIVLAALLALSLVASASALTIAIPDDATNEGRALLLLESNGYIKLDPAAGITATVKDIVENPLGIEFHEAEAAILPNLLADVDYAVINGNYALDAGLVPTKDGLIIESSDSPYTNVLSVKEENADADLTKALVAAITSQKVADFFTATYTDGSAIFVAENVTDGFDATVDYAALAGTKVTVCGTPTPHVPVLKIVKEILAEKDIKVEVIELTDYVTPNEYVESGDVYANFFAHYPYQESFNADHGTHLANVAGVHVEPMAMFGGKQADLSALEIK